ncbi:hypothetical protein ADL22_12725 [Streptomyces sp. NRRL F-4489]|uniref:histone-like nucleoid-structuring protein Lsr2 n=1 Tax=Streptomyces sp. NRRL F-4489 TaxID=1609095 RepID=UPI0007481207|nr:Lsr2 family protein [Streptomyces sp. NRRL F-4489]KUL44801.1 hypothetical protein ADL22_12725 [Streptomyces sp. NRRL F-4489]
MAQKVQILLVDDLDGGEAHETVTFALDGKTFEIDLSAAHAKKLRKSLEPFVQAGRRTGGRSSSGRGKARATSTSASGTGDTAKIRAWAKENNFKISERGRVPVEIREAYAEAQGE